MRLADGGCAGLLLTGVLLSMAAWPPRALAADDPNMDYLVHVALADHCKRVLPPLSKQIDGAFAAWRSRMPADRLAAVQAYAASKAGQRSAQGVGIAIGVAPGDNKLIASHQCTKHINDWGHAAYPQVSGSQIDAAAAQSLVASIAPLALARLDCQVLDGVAAQAIAVPMAVDAGKPVPTEQWTYSGCGRTHSVSIDRREGRYGLAAQDRFDLSGM